MDLVLTGGEARGRVMGRAVDGRGGVRACAEAVRRIVDEGGGEWVLFWDGGLGEVPQELILRLTARAGDVWHGGLAMGLRGKPELFDFVTPCWMLHGDPEEGIEASSWRVSLRCCLIRADLLRTVGGIDEGFVSLEGAGLDLGYRCLCAGAMMRFVPGLAQGVRAERVRVPLVDEARLVGKARGRKWLGYGLARAVMTGYCGTWEAVRAYRAGNGVSGVRFGGWGGRGVGDGSPRINAGGNTRIELGGLGQGRGELVVAPGDAGAVAPGQGRGEIWEGGGERVTVLVPTVDRYPYLRTLMGQLAQQTVRPHEVIVVDQTEREQRQQDWREAAAGLPLRVIEMDEAGQCSSRNAGLRASMGDWVLFLDDDDEVGADLIERFLESAQRTGADVVCGVAEEAGAGRLPAWFEFQRMSDVFPTNAGMVRREYFLRSGLFDLAYNRGARADGDLGTRMYRNGARMVLDPALRVLHHHAPRGGLRRHKARVATYASSRQSLWVRRLPEVTELYLILRFYTPRQVRESLVQSVLGTLAVKGRWWKRAAKAAVGVWLLPHTVWVLRGRMRAARAMLERFPRIERLDG